MTLGFLELLGLNDRNEILLQWKSCIIIIDLFLENHFERSF